MTLTHIFLAKTEPGDLGNYPCEALQVEWKKILLFAAAIFYFFPKPPRQHVPLMTKPEKTGYVEEKRDNKLCEQTKILPAAKGEKKSLSFLEKLVLINSSMPHHGTYTWRSG